MLAGSHDSPCEVAVVELIEGFGDFDPVRDLGREKRCFCEDELPPDDACSSVGGVQSKSCDATVADDEVDSPLSKRARLM